MSEDDKVNGQAPRTPDWEKFEVVQWARLQEAEAAAHAFKQGRLGRMSPEEYAPIASMVSNATQALMLVRIHRARLGHYGTDEDPDRRELDLASLRGRLPS